MSWVKLDDRFPTHPKIIGLSDKAFRLYVLALCYAAEHRTDGFVPGAFAGRPKFKVVAELVSSGLWDVVLDGWQIHDYLDYNPSASEWQELSQTRSKAGSKGAAKRWQSDSKSIAVPVPDPSKDAESNAPTASVDNNPNQPTDRQMYFGERLDVSVPSIVKLNKAHGRVAVLAAMEQLHGFPPDDPVQNAYAWLDTVASFKAVAV